MRIDPTKYLDDRAGRYAKPYAAALADMLAAELMGSSTAYADARGRFVEVHRQTMGIAELVGASTVLREAAKAGAGQSFAVQRFADSPTQAILPSLTFEEALDDFVSRTPVTIRDAAERTAANISRIYAEGSNFAAVRAADEAVTKKAQQVIAKAIEEGVGENEAGRMISAAVDDVRKVSEEWSEGYSRLVFRNNVNTATSAGRFRQVQDPDVAKVVPAFRYVTMDNDARDAHKQLEGLIMLTTNTEWTRVAPPIDHNCRCDIELVPITTLARMGRVNADGSIREDRVPAGWVAPEGFRHGGRPDLGIS